MKAHLPEPMVAARTAKPMDVDFEKAADAWDEAYEFLRREFAAE